MTLYARRVAAEFDTEHVSVSVSSGSVIVTTEIPVEDAVKASDIALHVTILSKDVEGSNTLYGAPSVIDDVDVIDVHTANAVQTPPPSAPPASEEEEDGTARAVIAVFLSLAVVVTALIIVYCVSFDKSKTATATSKDFPKVTYVGASFEAPTPTKVRFRL